MAEGQWIYVYDIQGSVGAHHVHAVIEYDRPRFLPAHNAEVCHHHPGPRPAWIGRLWRSAGTCHWQYFTISATPPDPSPHLNCLMSPYSLTWLALCSHCTRNEIGHAVRARHYHSDRQAICPKPACIPAAVMRYGSCSLGVACP